MGTEFYFFTDPTLLDPQTPSQAYGPAGALGGNDQFRVTDLHTSTSAADAYAVCRGRLCVHAVRNSANQVQSLNLILQPLDKPPFDFPYVEYFIYRNIQFGSLVTSSGDLDLGQEGSSPNQNDLIAYIRGKILKLPAASSNPAEGKYIGLDRVDDPAAGADGGVYGDAKPIDHLFRYAGGAELPIVEAGWKLGAYSAGSSFGMEVVVQTYGAQPKLEWARRDATALIEVNTLGASATANDKYLNRLARETIGCFVDPCAFWGMFFDNGLSFRAPASTTDDRKALKDKPLCDKLFTSGGVFKSYDRIYLNVRNETGYSYNFYGNYQDSNGNSLQIGSDPTNLVLDKYDVGGWPIYFKDGLTGNKLCFRLSSDSAVPLLFLLQTGGDSPGGAHFKDKTELLDASNPGWTTPITFECPQDSSVRPPWCFVAHYLRELDGSSAAPTGVFDTTPLQFGPIGDRVIAGYNELWPSGSTATPSAATAPDYTRIFISDKVLRYDDGTKSDPVDSTVPARSLTYGRVGDTYYIFQKGTAAATAGKDSAVIVQRRQYVRRKDFSVTWKISNSVSNTTTNQNLFFKFLVGQSLSTPIPKSLNTGSAPPVTVPTFLELLADTPVKEDLFDFTFLCLSKAAFGTAVAVADPISPDPLATEKHALFLSLTAPPASPSGYSAFDVECHGWDGQSTTTPLPAAAKFSIYSADGVFFSSVDFDLGSLSDLVSAYTSTNEEGWLSRFWDDFLKRDQMGSIESDRMRALVDSFGLAVRGVSATGPNPKGDLLALVKMYAPKIWDRAVLLAQDASPANLQECSDQILFCARANMEVALKSHTYVVSNPEDEQDLIKRFEELSRNYTNLDFSSALATEKQIVLTGFDPFGAANLTRDLTSNPSGKLALYFAASQKKKYSGIQSFNNQMFVRTCIFPVRWQDFDEGVIESVIGNAIMQTSATVGIACTCSLDPNIKTWIVGDGITPGTDDITQVHVRIDQFAGKCRDNDQDNDSEFPPGVDGKIEINDATLPKESEKRPFYVSKLKVSSGTLTGYDPLKVKLRYNETFSYDYTSSAGSTLNFSDSPDDAGIFYATFLSGAWPISISQAVADWTIDQDSVVVTSGSGGGYLSNEIFYRVSNLVQSNYSPANTKYASVKNGHIHLPDIGQYISVSTGTSLGELKLDDLAASVLAVIDGTLGP